MYRFDLLSNLPVFTIKIPNLEQNKIIHYQGFLNSKRPNLQRNTLLSQLPLFLDQLGKIHRTSFDTCIFISPLQMTLGHLQGGIVRTTILQDYDWTHPLIKLDWLIKQKNNSSVRFNKEYVRFLNRFPKMRGLLTLPYYSAFHSYFEDLGFYYVYHLTDNKENDNQELDEILEKVHPVFHPHILLFSIAGDQLIQQESRYMEGTRNYDYSPNQLLFMSYLNYIFTFQPQSKFHHMPDFLIEIVKQHYFYQSDIDFHFCFHIISEAINIELQNYFPSFNLTKYYNAFTLILDLIETKQQEANYHTFLAFHTLVNNLELISTRAQGVLSKDQFNVAINLLSNTVHILLDLGRNKETPFGIISLEKIKETLDLLLEQFDLNELSLFDQYIIIRLCFHINPTEFPHGMYLDLEEIAKEVIIQHIQLDKQWSRAKSIHFTFLQMDNYISYFVSTRKNPEELLENNNYSSLLQEQWGKMRNSVPSKELQKISFFYKPIEFFPEISEMVNIIFSINTPKKKISALLDLLENSDYQDILLTDFSRRLMIFLSDFFFEVPDDLLRKFLSLWSDDPTSLTLTQLMRHLLLHLLGDRDLTPEDLKYLREYLDFDPDLAIDLGAEGLADLMFTLSQLENTSDVDVNNEDGTVSKLQVNQETESSDIRDESKNDPNFDPYLPADIFEIFDNNEDLEHYLRLFFTYHSTLRKFLNDDSDLEKLYYDLLANQPEKASLNEYFPKFTDLRKEHPQVVDDIQMEILNTRLILREHPTFALPRLNDLEQVLRERDAPQHDWEDFLQLSLDARVKLDLTRSLDPIQTKLGLLKVYNKEWSISIHQYLDLLTMIDTHIYNVIDENSNITDLVEAIIHNKDNKLPEYASRELDPFVDLLVMIRLSWESSSDLLHLLQRYHEFSRDLVQAIDRGSDVWNGGMLIGMEALMIRIIELNPSHQGIDDICTHLQDGLANTDNRIKSLAIITDFYLSQNDLITSNNLLNYVSIEINSLPHGTHIPEEIVKYLAGLGWRAGAWDFLAWLGQDIKDNVRDFRDELRAKGRLPIRHNEQLTGMFPVIDNLLKNVKTQTESILEEFFSGNDF